MEREHVLVTGGAGFVGGWIVKQLIEQHPEFKVTILDVEKRDSWRSSQAGIDFIQADVTNEAQVKSALETAKPSIVIHAAGLVPAGNDRYSPTQEVRDRVYNVNVNGTHHILNASKSVGVKCFIFTSSITIVSDDVDHIYPNVDETAATGNASLVYGYMKGIAEKIVLDTNSTDFLTCAIRPSVILGPGDYQLLPTIHRCIAKGETPFVIGSADNLYDFVYVSNVADAHFLAVENLLTTKTAAGEAFFISNGQPIPFRHFCLAVWADFGHVPKFQIWIPTSVAWFAGFCAEWATWLTGTEATLSRGSVKDYTQTAYTNLNKSREILGYQPRVGLSEGIRLSCEVRDSKPCKNIITAEIE
ncbi:NAD(P)-binding protein [Tothia fuscella]|uniref:NAD(P)-binding protein n=1 Tax=Tothia fuscella TaxID=1048955 RepID=A0A9P4NRD8_9PEZI|nr:NAD(P)-binding protein [Tothia fuscella]